MITEHYIALFVDPRADQRNSQVTTRPFRAEVMSLLKLPNESTRYLSIEQSDSRVSLEIAAKSYATGRKRRLRGSQEFIIARPR